MMWLTLLYYRGNIGEDLETNKKQLYLDRWFTVDSVDRFREGALKFSNTGGYNMIPALRRSIIGQGLTAGISNGLNYLEQLQTRQLSPYNPNLAGITLGQIVAAQNYLQRHRLFTQLPAEVEQRVEKLAIAETNMDIPNIPTLAKAELLASALNLNLPFELAPNIINSCGKHGIVIGETFFHSKHSPSALLNRFYELNNTHLDFLKRHLKLESYFNVSLLASRALAAAFFVYPKSIMTSELKHLAEIKSGSTNRALQKILAEGLVEIKSTTKHQSTGISVNTFKLALKGFVVFQQLDPWARLSELEKVLVSLHMDEEHSTLGDLIETTGLETKTVDHCLMTLVANELVTIIQPSNPEEAPKYQITEMGINAVEQMPSALFI
ncbi:MAG: hypothetical protein ABH826_03460 [Patescibacteria group bacterium]